VITLLIIIEEIDMSTN